MIFDQQKCDYLDCDTQKTTSWGWVAASNDTDELTFCSQKHHDIWMEKNAGNFWDLKGLGSEDVQYGPRFTPKDDSGKIEYTCRLSPYIIEENKQAIIIALMNQFQGDELNPTIVAPQDKNHFILTVDSGKLNTHEIKDKILANYFIEGVSTRSDAKTVRNLHVDLNKKASVDDITSHVIALTKANKESDANHDKVEWIPLKDAHSIREFDRLDPIHDTGKSRSTVDSIKNSLLQEGFRNPLKVSYNINDRYAYLGEGNHRLIAAQELGLTHVPVTVYRYGESSSYGYKGRGWAKEFPGVEPDQFGYVPGNMTPTQIGLTHPSNVRTASVKQSDKPKEWEIGITYQTGLPRPYFTIDKKYQFDERGNRIKPSRIPVPWGTQYVYPDGSMEGDEDDYDVEYLNDIRSYKEKRCPNCGEQFKNNDTAKIYTGPLLNLDLPINLNSLLPHHKKCMDISKVLCPHLMRNRLDKDDEKNYTFGNYNDLIGNVVNLSKNLGYYKNDYHESSVNGQGYDAPVDSNLHAETEENPQYIIDQDNIDGPQRTSSRWWEDE